MKYQLSMAVVLGILGLCLMQTGCGQSAASHGGAAVAAAPIPTPEPSPPGKAAIADAPAKPEATPAAEPAAPAPAAEPAQSDAPKPPVSKQRLPADRQPRRPGDAEKITFEDLNLGMQPDVAYRPFMLTDRVKELDGQRVSLIGHMHEGQLTTNAVKEFVLLKNLQCKFGPGGQADHLGRVYLKEGTTTKLTKQAIKIEGTLKVAPFTGPDENTWSVYDITDATASPAK